VKTTLFPITMQGKRLGVRLDPPRFGADTADLLASVGYTPAEIQALRQQRAVA
jgi:crotonobetainyl-CoA:carnitine CoA-transferase CaiB-like acyl-CoA transferase